MRRLLPALCTLALLTACQRDAAPSEAVTSPEAYGEVATADERGPAGVPATAEPRAGTAPLRPAADTLATRRIRTGTASVRVRDAATARTRLLALTRALGGYAGDETTEAGTADAWISLTLRVPAPRFDRLLDTLGTLGTVQRRSLTTEDVTAAYVDLAARLRTRQAVEARYRTLLERASTVEEVLTVERALQSVREEIESAQGQLQLWDRQVAYATLTVTLVPEGGSLRPGLFAQAGEALRRGWSLLEELVLGALMLWPVWLIGGVLWILWRRRRRTRKAVTPGG